MILSLIFYLLVTVIYTYPVAFRLGTVVFGYGGDNFGAIWNLWWQNFAAKNYLDSSYTNLFNAPVGLSVSALPGEWGWSWPLKQLTFWLGEIPSFNLVLLLSFPLSALAMYLLVCYLFKSRPAAFFAGLVYMLAPYHFWQGYSHIGLALIQYLPLWILSFFYFDRQRNLRSAFFLSLSFWLVFLTSFYLGFFSFLITAFYFLGRFFFQPRRYLNFRTVGLLLVSAGLVFLGVWPVVSTFRQAKVRGVDAGVNQALNRQLVELLGLSGRPLDYLVYPPNHPFFGKFNKPIYDFWGSLSPDFKFRSTYFPERVVFVGWLNLSLAALAVVAFFRKSATTKILTLLLLAAAWLSLPPYFSLRGFTFYTPSFFIFKFFPLVRVYSRVGIFVFLFLTLLSTQAVARIGEKVKARRWRFVFYGLLTAVALFEFLPGSAYTDLSPTPAVYRWLKKQPGDFVILEYPQAFDLQSALLFQREHQKRILNMSDANPRFALWGDLKFLTNPRAHETLKREGVRYVIYHLKDLTPNPYDDWRFFRFAPPPKDAEEKFYSDIGLKRVAEFPEAIVYEVI